MRDYLVSVLVPIYKVEQYIERCLNSLFSQTIADKCEFILINDASPDNSISLAERVISNFPQLKDNIVVINKDKNEGLSAGRKSGILKANGKYIIHIDSDDWCELDMFEKMSNLAETNDYDIVNCDIIFEYKNSSCISRQNPGKTNEDVLKNLLNGSYGAFLPTKLVKREIYENNNILPDENISMWEDLNLAVPLYYYSNKIGYIPEGLYHYERSNLNSLCNNISEKYVQQLFTVVDNKSDFLMSKKPDLYSKDISNLKIRSKCFLFVQMDKQLVLKYRDKYKEENNAILKGKNIPIYNKIITYFLCSKLFYVGVFLLFVRKFLKRFRKR